MQYQQAKQQSKVCARYSSRCAKINMRRKSKAKLSFGWLVNPAASNYRQTYWKIVTKSFCFYRAVLIPLVYDIGSSGATFIQNNPAARAPAIGPSRCCGRRVLLDPSTYHSAYKAAGWNMTLWPSNNRGSIRTVRYSGDLLCNAGVESYK
jgi:hypothetical protein